MEQLTMLDAIGDMVIFASVAKAGSFTLAGQRLGLPKSTVSRRITQLEEYIGTRLINRSTRSISLTQEGTEFLEYCERLVEESDAALRFSEQLAGKPSGVLRVTMPAGFASLVLADTIERYTKMHPDVVLQIDETSAVVNLIDAKVDVAFRAGILPDSSLVARALPPFMGGFYASPGFVRNPASIDTIKKLIKLRFIGLGLRDTQKLTLTDGSRIEEVVLDPSIAVATVPTQIALALNGTGFIFSLQVACEQYIEQKKLVRLLPGWEGLFVEMHVLTPYKTLLPRKTEAFLTQVFKDLREKT